MGIIFFLILFPFATALVLLFLKADAPRDIIVKVTAVIIAAASVYLAIKYAKSGSVYFDFSNETVNYIMMIVEVLLAVLIIVLGIRYKKYLASLLAVIQTPLMLWYEFTKGHEVKVVNNLYVDKLSIIMILIIGIIGSLICIYALGYMKDFQEHHGGKDRRPWFFALMYIFLGAMTGLVSSNNLIWMYFFWEITSLCSFFLIGYNGLFHKKEAEDKIATRNAFRALIMNLLGGLSFACAIVILGNFYGTVEINTVIKMGLNTAGAVAIPAALLSFAGITKAAQMPFNSWLLGAMVAPTPTSALLHSSTMVKAGVFIIIKMAPVLSGNLAGFMTSTVGGITFLMASFAAISQSNAKKVLAYSTIANLGLIVACGGIGTPAAIWAGIMLIVFHAITKSLLFLCVGTAEHHIGSRDIEDMDGLFGRMPRLAAFVMVGIAGMFLAPFGMLISKWASMMAFIDSKNILLVAIICFGSAATAFYWIKWMGKMAAVMAGRENIEQTVHKDETFVQGTLVLLTVAICLLFPILSSQALIPYINEVLGSTGEFSMSSNNMVIMCIMVATVILFIAFFFGKSKKRVVPAYMGGVNTGDDLNFKGSMEKTVPVSLRNWYMESYFGETKMNIIGVISTSIVIVAVLGILVGTLVSMIGGM